MISARTLCLLSLIGCATPMSSLREDNQRLTQTVTELRSDRHTQHLKLRDMQHQLDELRAKLATDGSLPVLPVEVASPPAGAAAAAPGAPSTAPRLVGVADDGTEIIYEGDAASGRLAADVELEPTAQVSQAPMRPSPAQRAAGSQLAAAPPVPVAADRLEVMRGVPPISARAATRSKTRDHEPVSDRSTEAGGDYRAAVELVKAGKHDEAITALRAFIVRYPRHDYADNAQYWIGEAYYAQKDFTRALGEFRKVIEVYPRGNKVPDALLKVGYCYAALGQSEKARAMLEQVVTLYPKSEPATLAAKRLETP